MKCFGCSKHIISAKNCPLCDNLFCSDSCIDAHRITYHRINKPFMNNNNLNYNEQIIIPKTKEIYSKYITKGEIFNTIQYNQIYNLNNFVQILNKNNKPYIIGSGSYGQVYLCQNIINKKYYAIKHMNKLRLKKSLKTLSGIYTEIDLQSRISHQNIVQLLYVNESKSNFDLVMEYASHGSLFDFIRKKKNLSEELSFSIFIQVVNAIYFLHKNDLIHRDIKPENLLLFENNIVKLCDFGWCVCLNGGQRGTFCGTTEYMAPEMVNQKEYSKEIDIWSLGVLLYEMIHGHSPFIPKKAYFNEREVLENIKIHNLKFDKRISKECKELICHLLDQNRSKRYKIEDIFNSDFVKKYEGKIDKDKEENFIKDIKKKNYNGENLVEEKDKILHSKCVSHINYFSSNINLNEEHDIENEIKNNNQNQINDYINNNKTADNFYPKHYNKINISKQIEINNGNNSPMNNSPDRRILPEYKASAKIKNNGRKNGFRIFDKAIEYLNIREEKKKKIINIDTKNINNKLKKDSNDNINNEKDSFKIGHSNYSNSEGNNMPAMIKKHPVNSGNSMINTNYIKKTNAKISKIDNIIKKDESNGKIKNKSLISYKSNGEYLISRKNNSPIILKSIHNSNKSNKSNSKQKIKKIIKNDSSNIFRINKDNINNNKNNDINNTQVIEIKNGNLYLNENSKMRNYSDINFNSFKNTPDPEFFISNNDGKNNYILSSSKNKTNKNFNEHRVYQNINCVIINNSNNIISPNINQNDNNKTIIQNKDNNISFYSQQKMSKTPIKNKVHQKQVIKMDKKTIDYENDIKLEKQKKIRIKSKSVIKNNSGIKNNVLNTNIKKYDSQEPINNNILTIQKNNDKIKIKENRKIEFPSIMDLNIVDDTVNPSPDYKENSIELDKPPLEVVTNSLNKTSKLNYIKKDKEIINKMKINNNSFSGGKIIRNIIKENNNKSPFKIKNYINKKIMNENKKEKNNDVTVSEFSKIIDEKEYDVDITEEDEQLNTPKKTIDKVKIFPCRLINEMTKKFK